MYTEKAANVITNNVYAIAFSENDDGDIPNNRVLPTDGLPKVGSCLDSYAFYSHQDSCLPKAP